MNVSSSNQNVNITEDLRSLIVSGSKNNIIINNQITTVNISGSNNKILIKNQITHMNISGSNNKINGVDPNVYFTHLNISGLNNTLDLNQSCANISKNISGSGNKFMIEGKEIGGGSNKRNFDTKMSHHYDNNDVQNQFYSNIGNWMDSLNSYNQNGQGFPNFNNLMDNLNNFNNMPGFFNYNMNMNMNMNNNMFNNMSNNNDNNNSSSAHARANNSNNARERDNMSSSSFGNNNNSNNRNEANNASNNANRISNKSDVSNSINKSVNFQNLSDFEKKKLQLILEMDEYQYKHIQKYQNREEKECAICLGDFQGIDILKAFYKCDHIFHKKCLLDWLKKHNDCPYCKHDLSDDIKTIQ